MLPRFRVHHHAPASCPFSPFVNASTLIKDEIKQMVTRCRASTATSPRDVGIRGHSPEVFVRRNESRTEDAAISAQGTEGGSPGKVLARGNEIKRVNQA